MMGMRAALASVILLMLINLSVVSATTTVTFQPGAYIIDMSTAPPALNYANGLKPYGLVYDLIINKQIPVSWAINPTKAKDGVDFTVPSGTGAGSYRGGSFIIPVEYASDALTTLNYWKNTKLVKVVGPTTAAFSAPIYENLTSFPNAVLDEQNGDKIEAAFYDYSEVPMTSYRIGSPEDLTECDDIYAMPHADPQDWALSTQNIFKNFINAGGDLWAACHAVSALEADTPDYLALYYLSQSGLIPWGDHDDATPPYQYNASSATHPIMQFIGRLDNSLSDGSEQVYIPDTTPTGNNWRGSTTVAVWDPDQADIVGPPARPGILAAKVAYGYAEGNSSKGFIVYEASHTIASGNISEDVCAARVYGNFVLFSGILHKVNLTANVPTKMLSGSSGPVNVSIQMGTGTPPYTVKWSSSCGGSFANPTQIVSPPPYTASTTFTAPTVTAVTACIIRVTVTDYCGRRNFVALPVTIYPVMMTLTKTDYRQAVQKEELLPYRIYYNNTGPITAESVVITDLLPKGLTYIPTAYPAPASVTYNGIVNGTTTLVWNLGDVPAGASKLIRLNATVNLTATSPIVDNVQSRAYIAGMGPVYRTAKDTDILSPITKEVNKTTAAAGDYLNYSMCARYDDPFLLINATVKDTIPDYTTYVINSSNAGGIYFPGNKTIVWQLGSNEPGISSSTKPGTNVIKIYSIYDTYTRSGGTADTNYGASTTLQMSSGDRRSLLYFPISSIPPSATINSASFYGYFSTAVNGATVNIYNMSKYWCGQADQCSCTGKIAEGIVCNVQPDTLARGRGAVWGYYSYNKNAPSCAWTAAGGDYDKVNSYGTFVPSAAGVFNNTTVTSLVSGWKSGAIPNYGILLEYSKDEAGGNYVELYSKESAGTANDPYLLIFYTGAAGSPLKIYPRNDTYIRQDDALKNYGTCGYMRMDGGTTTARRPMLYFDISGIPAGATITNAYLNLWVNVAGTGGTATVRRMTRNWCPVTNCQCQGLVVEGKLNGAEPDTVAEGYGATWNNYMSNLKSTACRWNTLGGDYYTTTTRGTILLSNNTAGWRSGSVIGLVQGWYNWYYGVGTNPIPVQGIALTSTSGTPIIQSREGANKPYILVNYTIGQGTNISITARPLLSCEGGQIVVNMSVNSSVAMPTLVAPESLLFDSYNASLTLASGPTPPSYTNVPALSNRYFNYVYNVDAGDYPGSVAFSGKPSFPTYFATATSNRLLVTPLLTYAVQINPYPATPITVNFIPNTARFMDEAVVPSGVDSNEVVTNLFWPPNIQVTKSANISSGVKCNNVLFSLAVKNTGLANLVTVEVVDTLPEGLEYISSFNGSDNGQIITWANIGPMIPGQTKTLTFVGHITGDAFGLLNNTVWVKGTTINGNNVTNSSYYVVQALRTDISGTKTPDIAQGPPSTIVNYTVTMTNSGEATLSPAIMKDIFPHGMAFVNSTPAPSYSNPAHDTYFWNYTSLAPGETKTVYMNVHLDGEYYGELCNPVYFTGKTPSGLSIINSTRGCVYCQEPKISLNKSSNYASGDKCNINYSLNVTNTGEVPLYSISLVDYLPAGMQYLSSTGGGSNVSNTITWPAFGPLSPGSSQLFYVLAKIKHSADGPQENEANATGRSSTGWNYSSEDWENFTAHAVALEIEKGASPNEAAVMQNITFTINVTNAGNGRLDLVEVQDILPVGLAYVDDNQTPKGTVTGSIITWPNVGPLEAGEYANISLIVQANGAASGPLLNLAEATGDPEVGCPITAEDNETVTIFANANFTVVKTALNESVEPGDNAVFIINVTNTGEAALPTVRVVDILPIGLTYVSDNSTPPATVSGQLVTWNNVGPLAAGASKFIQIIAKVVL